MTSYIYSFLISFFMFYFVNQFVCKTFFAFILTTLETWRSTIYLAPYTLKSSPSESRQNLLSFLYLFILFIILSLNLEAWTLFSFNILYRVRHCFAVPAPHHSGGQHSSRISVWMVTRSTRNRFFTQLFSVDLQTVPSVRHFLSSGQFLMFLQLHFGYFLFFFFSDGLLSWYWF